MMRTRSTLPTVDGAAHTIRLLRLCGRTYRLFTAVMLTRCGLFNQNANHALASRPNNLTILGNFPEPSLSLLGPWAALRPCTERSGDWRWLCPHTRPRNARFHIHRDTEGMSVENDSASSDRGRTLHVIYSLIGSSFLSFLQLNDQEKFPFNQLLHALQCGAPPHGGIALGTYHLALPSGISLRIR